MQTRLKAYDRNGAARGILPTPLEVTYVGTLNDLPTASVHYPLGGVNSALLNGSVELALEVSHVSGVWVEPRNARFVPVYEDTDELEDVRTTRYDFIGVGEALGSVYVYNSYGLTVNENGSVQFANATAGKILNTVWANAQSRGWTGYTKDFTDTVDSNGQAWGTTFTMAYGMDTSLKAILDQMVRQGLIDYWFEGRKLRVFKFGSPASAPRLEGTPSSFFGQGEIRGIDSAPFRSDSSKLASHIVVIGEEGARWEFPTGVSLPDGRRELFLTYSGVSDVGTATIMAQPYILQAQNMLRNITRQFHVSDSMDVSMQPLNLLNTGAWVDTRVKGVVESTRIRTVSITANDRGIQGYYQLGDKVDELLDVLYKQVQRVLGSGSSESTGTPPAPSDRTPTAPTGLAVSNTPYTDNEGATKSQISATWAHDGKDINGDTVGIDHFIFDYRESGDPTWLRLAQTPDLHATYSPLETKDRNGNPASYDFSVYAVNTKGVYGGRDVLLGVVMDPDTTPPPKPDAPVAMTWLRTNTVRWSGKGRSDTDVLIDMPKDLSLIYLYESTSSDMAGATLVYSARGASSWTSPSRTAGTTYYYALKAVDFTGNVSGYSTIVSATPTANVDLNEILNDLTEANIADNAITANKLAANSVVAGKIAALAVKAGNIDANAVTSDKIDAGAVKAQHLEAQMVLASEIVAGPVNDTHASMKSDGFRVYAKDPQTGLVNEAIRLGVAASDDYFAVQKSDGSYSATISQDGTVTGKMGNFADITYKGRPMDVVLGEYSRGIVAWGQFNGNQLPNIANGEERGLFELAWVPDSTRMYKLTVSPVLYTPNGGVATAGAMKVRYTTDGSQPTTNSTLIAEDYEPILATGSWTQTFQISGRLIGGFNGSYIRILVTMAASNGNGLNAELGQSPTFWVEDVGPAWPRAGVLSSQFQGGGGGSYAEVATREAYFDAVNSRSFDGAGNFYNYDTARMYQGLSPAGYGDLKSMAFFNDMTGILSGATINDMQCYFYFDHWYFNSGGTARIGVHGWTGAPPSAFGYAGGGWIMDSGGWPKPGGRWLTIPSAYWAGFKSGAYRGLTLGVNSASYGYYGIASAARIYVQYTK